MEWTELSLQGVYQLKVTPHEDERGVFYRAYEESLLQAQGLHSHFPQHSIVRNHKKATLRGLHYQAKPFGEVKLVQCIRGRAYDVLVDIREESPSYLQHCVVMLEANAPSVLYVPKGIAHGYLTLQDDTELLYHISCPYQPEAARGLRWDDAKLAIKWPMEPAVISPRDRELPYLDGGSLG